MSTNQMPEEQFEQFIKTVKDLVPQQERLKSRGNISKCNKTFAGYRNQEAVEEFITAIEAYKDKEHISDEDALKGISLLLIEDADVWWKGVRRQVNTWREAITMLREHFSPTNPPYQIYQEIFETKQGDYESIDNFVCRKRELLAKLPEGLHNQETELNFIYGLLAPRYRKHIPRTNIKTFKDLLKKGRLLEKNS